MSDRAEVIAKAIRDNGPVDWMGPRFNQYARIWATAADYALSPDEWPLSMVETNQMVGYLLSLGTRDGILLGGKLNNLMGASARRKAGIDDAPAYHAATL